MIAPCDARPITDRRLAELRREANGHKYCLSSDVRRLIARLDVAETELRTRSLPSTQGPAPTGPASAAASSRADGS